MGWNNSCNWFVKRIAQMGSDPVITDLIMTPPHHNLTVLTKHANGKTLPISWFISISPTDRHRLYFVIIFCSLSFFLAGGCYINIIPSFLRIWMILNVWFYLTWKDVSLNKSHFMWQISWLIICTTNPRYPGSNSPKSHQLLVAVSIFKPYTVMIRS